MVDVDDIRDEVDEDVMIVSKLLEGVTVRKMFQTMFGRMVVTHDVEVRNLRYDSRKVERGDLFVALRGSSLDGTKFIADAIDKGAIVVVVDDDTAVSDSYCMHAGVVKVVVENARAALAQMSANYFQHPSKALTMVGVTGTNGKTTTTHILKKLLEASGTKTGLIGTIDYRFGDERIPATHTTPESLELQGLLKKMVEKNCTAAIMEVSSHALHQHRVDGIDYDVAVFTNLTQDHLDYHGTMDEYFKAKKILFDNLRSDAWAIVNVDDEWGQTLLETVQAKKLSFGFSDNASVKAANVSLSTSGTKFTILREGEETPIETPLLGRFNVVNILAAFSAGIALELDTQLMQETLRTISPVRGRFERVVSPKGWTAIIDYAHTPDALEKALNAVRDILRTSKQGNIITVFGCGGNRDRTKRPKMAQIATKLSDITIVTSDNPRHEDPEAIIDEVMTGVMTGAKVHREADRKQAIHRALEMAKENDVVLIAGKGHEDYQVIGDEKIPFSDRIVVEEYLRADV